MAYGCFTVRGVPPTMEEARAAVGGRAGLWDRLMACAAERYRARPNFTFYGRNHGWALVFRKAGKALLGVFPDREAVTALVVLPVAEAALAASLDLQAAVLDIVRGTPQLKDGRWLFLPVRSARDAADVERLVALKAEALRRR